MKPKPKKEHWIILVILLIALSMIGGTLVLALSSFFWQRAPTVPPNTENVFEEQCIGPEEMIASPSIVDVGSSGQISFFCQGTSAFYVSYPVNVVPVFESEGFNPPYTSLWIYISDGQEITGPCASRSGAIQLQNNTLVNIPEGSYNYCAEYVSVGPEGLNAWAIGWYDEPCTPEDQCGET